MANATITAPQDKQTGNFSASVAFDASVTGFEKTDVRLRALSGNGITGVDFALTGTGDTYALSFTLPTDKAGIFEIRVTGMVTPQAETEAEAVTADTAVVIYDTRAHIIATFGTVEYRDAGVVVVPVTFAEAVIAPSKSVFDVSSVSGDALTDVTYTLTGSGTAYELAFQVPPDRNGSFQITVSGGHVLKDATKTWEGVSAVAKTVAYDTRIPRIVNFDIPENYEHGKPFDVRIAYNVRVTGWHANNTFTDIFIEEGAHLGASVPYKWTGSTPPDFETPVPDDLAGTDWQVLATPPGGHQGAWHGEEGQYYLIRFPNVENTATGVFQMTPRDSGVRGPTGS